MSMLCKAKDVWPKLFENTSGKASKVLSNDFLFSGERLGLWAVVNSVSVSGSSLGCPPMLYRVEKLCWV